MNKNSKSRQVKQAKASRLTASQRSEATKPAGAVVSASPAKNIQMVVRHNVYEDGKRFSSTSFEPMNSAKTVYRRKFKNE